MPTGPWLYFFFQTSVAAWSPDFGLAGNIYTDFLSIPLFIAVITESSFAIAVTVEV
jgi:hypothetical protein